MNLKLKMLLLSLVAVTIGATSCSNNKSYAEQLADERVAVNLFLAGQRVGNDVPADTIFETGSNAPYYRIDEDGNVYMQVLSNTGLDARPKTDDVVYFRYMRYNVIKWCVNNGDAAKVGNMDDMKNPSTYFLYDNYTVETSVQYGQGIQMPLQFVGVGSEVNLIIKSQKGLTDEVADVNPYHWHVRYYKSTM